MPSIARDAVEKFIKGIPDGKLKDLPKTSTTGLVKNIHLRLDMQGMTSDKPPKHNLQVQVNNETTITTLKVAAKKTIAGPVFAPLNNAWPPAKIRAALLKSILPLESNANIGSQPNRYAEPKGKGKSGR